MNWGTRKLVVINKEKIGPSTTDFRGDITIIKKKILLYGIVLTVAAVEYYLENLFYLSQ